MSYGDWGANEAMAAHAQGRRASGATPCCERIWWLYCGTSTLANTSQARSDLAVRLRNT